MYTLAGASRSAISHTFWQHWSRTTFGFVWMLTVILNSGAGAESAHGANTVVGSRSESTGSAVVRQVLNLLEGTNERSTSVFVRAVARMLHVYSMWGCGFSCMRRVCVRFVCAVCFACSDTCKHVPTRAYTWLHCSYRILALPTIEALLLVLLAPRCPARAALSPTVRASHARGVLLSHAGYF